MNMAGAGLAQCRGTSGQGARTPLYRRIADGLLRDIRTGRYPVGEALPSEVDLSAELKVSRGSVRDALRILADGGVVERARKLGTRVVRREPVGGYVQRLDGLNQALGFGRDTIMRIDEMRDVAATDEPLLAGEQGGTGYWLRIDGVRHMPDDPDAVTTSASVYVNGLFAGIRPLLSGEIRSVYELVERLYGLKITRLRHRVAALALPARAAADLGLPAGRPALQVDAWLETADGILVEVVRSIHNPDRFVLEFAAESAG